MKIYLKKTVNINLDKEIHRVNQIPYTDDERERLLNIYSAFRDGEFQTALDLINKLPDTPTGYSEKEHLMSEISDFYMDFKYSEQEIIGFEK